MNTIVAPSRIAVVSGATGVAGSEVINQLLQTVDENGARLYHGVYVLTRRSEPVSMLVHRELTEEERSSLHVVQVDLLNDDSRRVGTALSKALGTSLKPAVTLVYSAMFEKGKAPLGRFNLCVLARRSFQGMNAVLPQLRNAVNAMPPFLQKAFFGFLHASSGAGHADENERMLVTAVEACHAVGNLAHVSLVTGGKM
jgi:hypothetical protein